MPAGIDHLLPHILAFALVVARLSGLFIFGPLVSSIVIPMRLKAILILAMSAAIYPVAPAAPESIDLSILAPAMVIEVGIGLVIGILAAIPLLALEMSGVLIGQQMGFGLAKVFNPEVDFDTDLIGQLLFYIAAGAFLALGGIETMFGCVVETFHRVPLGGFDAARTPLEPLVGLVASGFELAWRVAAPVTATILLMVVALGVIGKTMPQINIMTVGFTMKILAGLAMLAASVYAAQGAVWDYVAVSLRSVMHWAAGP
ncbi:MAG: hypothetical protein GIKADHBN_02803 [Phycisphaerales bacterium]|nr:hypothetical protein [Phycisphaerales bacterium]